MEKEQYDRLLIEIKKELERLNVTVDYVFPPFKPSERFRNDVYCTHKFLSNFDNHLDEDAEAIVQALFYTLKHFENKGNRKNCAIFGEMKNKFDYFAFVTLFNQNFTSAPDIQLFVRYQVENKLVLCEIFGRSVSAVRVRPSCPRPNGPGMWGPGEWNSKLTITINNYWTKTIYIRDVGIWIEVARKPLILFANHFEMVFECLDGNSVCLDILQEDSPNYEKSKIEEVLYWTDYEKLGFRPKSL